MFGLFETHYPVYGFLGDCRAMTADEILQMQVNQHAATQQAIWPLSFIQGMNQYRPPERPLDERFADFKIRLAAAIERHQSKRVSPSRPIPARPSTKTHFRQ